ncbi:MAG TPA: DotU family type IV/VI secretion system protein [Longimicrobiaceae bacterium]|nr:DotU family type IV/VI secretion system protein [Longimicrobiaceae bacterium]
MSAEREDSFLLRSFREYYDEVVRQKRAVLADPWGIGAREADGTAAEDPSARAARRVGEPLVSCLESQALDAGKRGGEFGASLYREAQYVMAALGDEVFLGLEWQGKGAWEDNLLETRLFGTHTAGEQFFRRLDQLLKDRDPVHRELGAVYLMALCLGFKGRFRGTVRLGELEEYRRQLFSFVFRRQPSLLKGERKLFPQAYAHTVAEAPRVALPHTGRWLAALAVVVVFYLAVSHGLWRDVTLPLRSVNDRIAQLAAQ